MVELKSNDKRTIRTLSGEYISDVQKTLDNGNHNISSFDRLRKTDFYSFYTRYLKQIPLVRWLFLRFWKNFQPNSISILRAFSSAKIKHDKRWRPLIKLNDFIRHKERKIAVLEKKVLVETPSPQVFPAFDQFLLNSPHDHYEYPEIYVATVKRGMVYGGSNLIFVDDMVISHDLYDFKHDFTSEELHSHALIDPKYRRIRWVLNDAQPLKIPIAATFLDACAPNYAHWMTEVLPRIAVFCADDRFKEIPIVVDDRLHRNIMESLFWITEPERKILRLPIGKAIYCDTLYVLSVTGYVPFDWRSKKMPSCSHGLFSPQAFRALSERLDNQVMTTGNQRALPDKIFLRRNSEHRIIINSHEVESFFKSRGYIVVEPEKLSFHQQVALFTNAKAIAGPTGAAFANIIFAPADCDIHIFISKHPDTIYWYWQNIACASGKKIKYVFGNISESKINGIHASFSIDVEELEVAFPHAGS